MTVYNIEDEIDYTKQSILQFTNESEGIYTRTNEEDGYMWNTDFTYWKIQCKLPPKTKRFCPLVLK